MHFNLLVICQLRAITVRKSASFFFNARTNLGTGFSGVTDPAKGISFSLFLSLSVEVKRSEDSEKMKLKRRKSSDGDGVA